MAFWNKKKKETNILDPISMYLDPTVWDDPDSPQPKLKEDHRLWIHYFIVNALDSQGYTRSDQWLSLVLTGSLTTYQYSPDSDCDISLFIDTETLPDWSRAEMIGIMMEMCDGVLLPGTSHPLQCYVVDPEFGKDDLYKPGLRSGYDITENRWIVAPEKNRSHDVKQEMNAIYVTALEGADKMEKLLRYEPYKAVMYYKQIHRRRKADMEAGKGDYSTSNVIYKMLDSRGLLKQIHDLEPSPTRVEMSDYDKNERFGAIDYDDMRMFNVPSNNDMDQNIIDENSIRGLEPKFVSESNPVNYQIPRSKRGLEPESVSDSDPINYQTLYDRKMPSAEPDWIKDLKERYPEIQNMTEVEISNYFGPNKIIKNLMKGRGSNLAIEPMSEE